MKKRTESLLQVFQPESSFRYFLLCVVFTGLSYGLYKGVIDNYVAEVVGMGEMDRGIMEFFRELPGIALVFILAVFYMLSAERLFQIGLVIMLVGMALQAVLPPNKVLLIMAMCLYSVGDHMQLGMKSALALQYARPGKGGAAQGIHSSMYQIGTLVSYLVVIGILMVLPSGERTYRMVFLMATILAGANVLSSMGLRGSSAPDRNAHRFYFHRKYHKYYMLEMFYGARKQVFLTFGPYLLILFYGANAATISLLFALSAVASFLAAPLVGRIVDRIGYKTVMVADTLILVVVCFFYGWAHHLFPRDIAFLVCCVNYVLDCVISLASMATNVYVQELSDNADEMKATISTGLSINHVITIFIALFGGWIWEALGIEVLFAVSAVLGLCNSAYAATIRPGEGKKTA